MTIRLLPTAQRPPLARPGWAHRHTSPPLANRWLRYLVICAGIMVLPILLALSLLLWMGTGNWSLLPFWS